MTHITGPSNTGPNPIVTLGTVSSPVVRTGIQAALAEGAVRLVETIPDPDLIISAGDRAIILIVAVAAVSLVQNLGEKIGGRRLIGTPS